MTFSRPIADPLVLDRRAAERRPFRKARRIEERVRLMGAEMDLVRAEEVMHLVEARIAAGQKTLIANHNLHSLHLIRRDETMQRFFDLADLIEVDSTPLLAWARLVGQPGRTFHRCTYLDWREHFWSLAERRGWKVFYLGGAPGVAERAIAALKGRWPKLNLSAHHGYFKDHEAVAVENAIVRYAPDVLFVGMGMPRQEHWIEQAWDRLPPCSIFSLGAAFDYEAGVQRAAPRWAGRLGVEWLFRLAYDPGRLARRYLVEPWFLIDLALADLKAVRMRKRTERQAKT